MKYLNNGAIFWTKYLTMKLSLSFFLVFFLVACSSTSPTDVKQSEAQSIKNIEYGYIKSSIPVKVKGEGGIVGAATGAMIGGLLGTAVCGESEVAGTKCQDIGIVYGTIGGAALGYVTQAFLGNHDGFQYIITLDSTEKDIAIVQANDTVLSNGERVVIIYGENVRVLPYEG
jgi:outer membrane lipoprotein SlyB